MFKSIKSLDGDRGVDRCHYTVPFKGILIRSTPEIVLSSKQNQLQVSEDERRAKQDDKLVGNELARFLMGTIFLVYAVILSFLQNNQYENIHTQKE